MKSTQSKQALPSADLSPTTAASDQGLPVVGTATLAARLEALAIAKAKLELKDAEAKPALDAATLVAKKIKAEAKAEYEAALAAVVDAGEPGTALVLIDLPEIQKAVTVKATKGYTFDLKAGTTDEESREATLDLLKYIVENDALELISAPKLVDKACASAFVGAAKPSFIKQSPVIKVSITKARGQ